MELKKEVLIISTLQKEVQALKEDAEVKNLKEQMIAHILMEQDKAKLTKLEKKIREILFPKRPGAGGEGVVSALQGNK
ncbi:MAG: hypothetical protein LBH82_07175 [Bacteroidales bacterium]|nr:hypothetical protein [Bacteroidales bacterium]